MYHLMRMVGTLSPPFGTPWSFSLWPCLRPLRDMVPGPGVLFGEVLWGGGWTSSTSFSSHLFPVLTLAGRPPPAPSVSHAPALLLSLSLSVCVCGFAGGEVVKKKKRKKEKGGETPGNRKIYKMK